MFNKRCLYLVLGVFVGCSQTVMALERRSPVGKASFFVLDGEESRKIEPVDKGHLRAFTPLSVFATGFFFVTNKETVIGGERVPENTLVILAEDDWVQRQMKLFRHEYLYSVYELDSKRGMICTRESIRNPKLDHTKVLPNGLIKGGKDRICIFTQKLAFPELTTPFKSEDFSTDKRIPRSGHLRLAIGHFNALSDARSRRCSELRAVFVGAVFRAGQKRSKESV